VLTLPENTLQVEHREIGNTLNEYSVVYYLGGFTFTSNPTSNSGKAPASYSTVQRDTSTYGVNIEEFDQRVSILEVNPTEYTDKRNTFERDLHHRLLRRLFKQG
jgi:hypothetical protein